MRVISADKIGKKFFSTFGEIEPEIIERVQKIIEEVRQKGDRALLKFTRLFDGVKLKREELEISEVEKKKAAGEVSPRIMRSISLAQRNIERFHRKNRLKSWCQEKEGVKLGQQVVPLQRVGIYVPGGQAGETPLVSTILMAAIPARIAGVEEIVMATPPRLDGSVNPYLIATASQLGVERIFKIGGAQAIAAFTWGTETVPRVDKIVGPGNVYVTTAKKLVYGQVGLDILAGPSEIVVLADQSAPPEFVAAELLGQAEHQTDSVVILITTSPSLIKLVKKFLTSQVKHLPRQREVKSSLKKGKIILVRSIEEAIELINRFAPEHLSLLVTQPEKIARQIKNAGTIFQGLFTPVALGDYLAGPNHILPTAGRARFSSALSTNDFLKVINTISYSQLALKRVEKHLTQMAFLEKLTAHQRSVEVRLFNQGKEK